MLKITIHIKENNLTPSGGHFRFLKKSFSYFILELDNQIQSYPIRQPPAGRPPVSPYFKGVFLLYK